MKTRLIICNLAISYVLSVTALAAIWAVVCGSAQAQGPQLVLYYDFEDGTVNDLSGYEEDADGVLVGLGSIVASGDPDRGMVVDTGSLGFGAEVDAVRKMDFRNSFTLQSWFKTGEGTAGLVFRTIAGRGGSGPRIFNHHGTGGVGTAQLFNTEFGLFDGFPFVDAVSPTPIRIDGEINPEWADAWHHQLLTWNAGTRQLWIYYDGFDGGNPGNAILSPVDTLGDILVTHGDTPFAIGGFTQQSLSAFINGQVDDVAFWQGYAPPAVAQGLFDGTIAIEDAAAMMELPTQSADFDADNDRDGADFLTWQRGFGLDDISTPGEDDPDTPEDESGGVDLSDGDANRDARVTGRDLAVWEMEFGTVVPPISGSLTVPEPGSIGLLGCLLGIGGSGLLLKRTSKRIAVGNLQAEPASRRTGMKTPRKVNCSSLMAVVAISAVACGSAQAQGPQLILHYDFEDGTVNDLSGYEEDADGVLVGLGSIVASGDADRGMVVDTGSLGFGAEVDSVRKMDFRNSFTIQAWFKTAEQLGVFQMVVGRGGSGPRIFNHWGLGGLGTAQMFNTEFGLFDGFTPVQIVSPTGFVDGSTWHHELLTWNAATHQLWGYYDGFDGGDPADVGLTPVDTLGDILLTQGDTPFAIGGFTQQSASALKNSQLDDVAFWQGYAPPAVAQGLFDGTIAIEDAAAMMELPTQSADFDADNDVDGADFLTWQRGFGLDDIRTPGEDDPNTPEDEKQGVFFREGDANRDARVTGRDLAVWEMELGTVITPMSGSLTVPEPATGVLIATALVSLTARRRRVT